MLDVTILTAKCFKFEQVTVPDAHLAPDSNLCAAPLPSLNKLFQLLFSKRLAFIVGGAVQLLSSKPARASQHWVSRAVRVIKHFAARALRAEGV